MKLISNQSCQTLTNNDLSVVKSMAEIRAYLITSWWSFPQRKTIAGGKRAKPCLADGTIINTTHIGDLRTPFTEKRVRIYEKQKVIGILRHASIMILHTPKSIQSRNIFSSFLHSFFFFFFFIDNFPAKIAPQCFSVTPASGVTLHFCPCGHNPNNIGLHPLCSALSINIKPTWECKQN